MSLRILASISLMAALCAAGLSAQTYLINENFNAGSTGWTVTQGGITSVWGLSTTGPSTNPGTLNGSQHMLVDADAGATGAGQLCSSTLTSPTFNGTTAPGALYITFQQYFRLFQAGETGVVQVYNGSTWTSVFTVSATIGGLSAPNSPVIDITAYKNASNQVRFIYQDNTNWGYYWLLDNIQVYYSAGAEIDVQRPAGAANSIASGGRSDVGQAAVGTPTNFSWTVENQGSASLTHTAVIAGSPAAVNCTFGTITLPASTASSTSSTLTIPVTPTAAGFFTFRISITNNDTNENPYLIDVSGIALGGSVLFYGGDADLVDGTVNGRGYAVPNDVFVYEDFTVPAGQTWTVTQLFSNNYMSVPVATQADWEIRTGVATGTGGTLVGSGTGLNVSLYPTGRSAFGYTEYTVITHLATAQVLTAGTYFVGVRPVSTGFAGNVYVSTTAGTNGVGTPLGNDLAFGNQTGTQFAGLAWEQLSDGGSPPIYFDYSIGVRGTSAGGSTPTLTVSTNNVTVPTTTAGTAGTATSFTVSGSNLTPASGSVTLTLVSTPAGIEMRNATAAGTFGTGVITINYTGSAFAAQTIEVRFASTATATTYTGTITVAGGGATNQVVNLSGTVNSSSTPTLTVSTNNVTVPTTSAGTAGTATSFTVSGSNLTPASGSVTLTLVSTPAGIEMRNATAAGTFGTGVITINYTGSAFAAQTIEVRFASTATATTYTGTITVAGGGATNQVVNLSGTVTVAGGLTIVTTTLPNGVIGATYNATITAQNGTGPYTWSLASGTLPTGLTLNTAATGLTTSITGTPTAAGVFTFTIQVADSAAATDTQLYNVTVTSSSGGGTIGGGGGGGGGCTAETNNAPWFALAAVAGILLVAVRRRRTA
ncbi:hypothetical protein PLCT2_01444 [Planctomycetaceae bacterium]|nr:hypothetical protein PLCT2_01444 [Planctomycetaceae bacterium]